MYKKLNFIIDFGYSKLIHDYDEGAFRLASSNGHLVVVLFLVSQGADISVLEGTKYYDFAVRWNRIYCFSGKCKLNRLERGKKALYHLIVGYLHRLHSFSCKTINNELV